MSIRVTQPGADAPAWQPWEVLACCTVCDPRLYMLVPVSPIVSLSGMEPVSVAFEFLRSRGWQIEPTRCPEHARVVA